MTEFNPQPLSFLEIRFITPGSKPYPEITCFISPSWPHPPMSDLLIKISGVVQGPTMKKKGTSITWKTPRVLNSPLRNPGQRPNSLLWKNRYFWSALNPLPSLLQYIARNKHSHLLKEWAKVCFWKISLYSMDYTDQLRLQSLIDLMLFHSPFQYSVDSETEEIETLQKLNPFIALFDPSNYKVLQ